MAVYYKFKSAKDYDSIPIDGHFISVANLKEKIFESKHLGRGTDFDLVVTNAQTNEEYLNEATLVPKNTSVLIRRVPGQPRIRIHTSSVSEQEETMVDYNKPEEEPAKSSFVGADLSIPKYPDDSEWDEFGNDLYAMPEVLPVQSTNPVLDAPAPSKADEDSKIKALIDTPALDWQHQPSDGFGLGRGFGRGMGGRMMGGRGFGRGGGGLGGKTPPQGYICHRCKVPGHFIQHCPTNGDPNFDVKRVKPPTGIPKSMLMATPDGSYALPSGAVAVLKPNEAAFEKEIEGMPSSRPVGEFPQELRCPLCKEGMKDAVLTSKCCFKSFCDKCIRDYIISRSACVCGATNILADDLLPNKTLRDTINRLLESNNNNSSAENGGSAFQVQDMESARCPQPKVPSPAQSGVSSKGETAKISASKGEPGPTQIEDTSNIRQPSLEQQDKGFVVSAPQQSFEKRDREVKVADVSEATHESRSMKEPVSHGSAPMVDEEVQQKALSGEAGKKKKKKKIRMPTSGEMQWRNPQEFAPENYMMPMGPPPPPYNPFWNGMPGGMDGYLGGPYPGPMPPYMGFGFGPMDVPFGGVLPPDPFAAQGYMMPPFMPPQRDLADFGMGLNGGPPIMSREEFEARKADLKRKREMEQRRGRSGREFPNDREFSREMSSTGDISSMKLKSSKSNIPPPQRPTGEQQRHRLSPERHQEPPRESSKRKSDYYDDEEPDYHRDRQHHHSHHRSESGRPPVEPPPSKSAAAAAAAAADAADRKLKASVFSRISFPEREEASSAGVPKKRKVVSEPPAEVEHHSHRASVNGYREEHHKSSASMSRKSASVVEYESSDEDRHFKRRPSRYESSPVEESGRHSRGSRDRVRDERDRSGHSKHR